MRRNSIIVIAILALLLLGGIVIYKIYSNKGEFKLINNNQPTDNQTGAVNNTGTVTWKNIFMTYQWQWEKDVTNTFFDDEKNREVVAKGLDTPRSIAFKNDKEIYVTERGGSISLVNIETKDIQKRSSVPASQTDGTSERWLLGIVTDPDNSEIVYVAYTYKSDKWYTNTLVKIDHSEKDEKKTTLIDGAPGNDVHNWGKLAIWPDEKLYRTLWDAEVEDKAQDIKAWNGKILRVNLDGLIPADNPYPDSYVWSYGHRNTQWIARQPWTNYMRSSDHWPSQLWSCCRDELNIVLPWKNYGRPVIRGDQTKQDMQEPIWISGSEETWAPGWITFVKNWQRKDSLLVAWLRWEAIYRVEFDSSNPTKIKNVERHLHDKYGRLRDVYEHDWYIYILTSNKDWRQLGNIDKEDDRILRIKMQ